VLQGSWAVGYLLAALVFGVVVPHWGWRALFIIAALPALLVLPIRIWVPESEEWKARKNDARAQIAAGAPVANARLRGHLKTIGWASVVMGCGFGAYYGLTGLYPTLLDGAGMKPAEIAHHVTLFNIGMMGGAIVTGILAAKKGVARAVAVPALASLPFLPLYVGAVPPLLGVGAFFGGGLAVGFTGVTPLFLTGLFPPEVRARAVGVVYHVGALFAAFVPSAMAFLVQHAHVSLPRAILVVAIACELGLVALFSASGSRRRSSALAGSASRSEPAASATAN
jgi:MFS transporter, SHS family, lactate transporter